MKSKSSFLLVFMLCVSFIVFSQKITDKKLQIIPYVGLSSPQGDFKNVSDIGSVLGFSLDKYLSSKLALGIDLNYQTNPFLNEFDYGIIPSPSVVTSIEQGSWTNTTITFGPTYSFGANKISTEIYTKAGISIVKSPSANATFSHPAFPNFDLFDLREQKVTSFGITSGIRFNYNINEKFAVFINPQYVISGAEINYFYKDPTIGYIAPNPDLGIEGYFDPGLVNESPGVDGVIKPSHFNLNAGIKIGLGGKKIEKKTKTNKPNLYPEKIEKDKKENLWLKIVSHKKGVKIRLKEDKIEKLSWKVIGDSKNVKFYKVQVYHTNFLGKYDPKKFLIEEKIVSKTTYNFKPKLYSETEKEYFYFEVVGLDEKQQEITNNDARQLSASRNVTCLEIEVDSIQIICKNPAYDQINGKIHYTGNIYISNKANCSNFGLPLDAILNGPPPSWMSQNIPGSSIISDYLIGNAYSDPSPSSNINNSDWGWSLDTTMPLPTAPTTPINIAPGNQIVIPIDLWFKQVPQRVDFSAYATNATTPATSSNGNVYDEIDDCMCDPCENFEEMAVNVNSINLNPMNHPSHSILEVDQTIMVGSNKINTVKAELVYFEEIIPNDPTVDPNLFEQDLTGSFAKKHLCQICNAKIDGLGIFNGNNLINNQSASNPTTRTSTWYFTNSLNMTGGVNSKLSIGVPKSNPLECCNSAYKFTIRYTFEDENCKKCELLVDYSFN